MKRLLLYSGVLLFAVSLSLSRVSAQAPAISYTPSTNALLVGVPFSISPANSGGSVPATTYGQVTTLAGSTAGTSGYTDATGTSARFNFPQNIVGDASGNLYVGDYTNNVIREISPSGVVTTFAGSTSGTAGYTDATGTSALFNGPEGMAIDASGNIYVGDFNNNVIRKITPAGVVSTFATGCNGPAGLCFDSSGNLFVAEQNGNQISEITSSGVRSVYAGSGTAGRTNNSNKLNARFNNPIDVQVDASGNVFVADYSNNEIRKIPPTGTTSDFAGSTFGTSGSTNGTTTGARFNGPAGLAMDAAGNFYVADYGNNEIRLMTSGGVVSLLAGSSGGTAGNTDGTLTAATFYAPVDMYIDANGYGYISCGGGNNIRKMCLTGYTISPTPGSGLSFDATTGILSGTPTGTFGSTTYTITAYNTSGSSSTTIILSCTNPTVNTWKGINSTWTNTANWSRGHAPTSTETAEIGVTGYTGTSQPTLSASTTVKALVFGTNNTPTLTINSGATLTVSSGMGVQSSTTATINGPGTISLGGSSSVVSGSSLTISSNGIVSLAASSQLSNSGTFTLSSSSTGTSSIAAVPATSTITGSFTVERYVTGGSSTYRGYRLFSSPVNTDGTNYSISYLKNYIYITSTKTTGGFDNTAAANPSLYLYRENLTNPTFTTFTGSNFRGINDITTDPIYGMDDTTYPTTNIPVGNGFLCFFRGNRGATSFTNETKTTYVPQTVTMSTTGSINYGSVTVSDWFTPSSANLSYTAASPYAGFNLVGNPYPSSIDWDSSQTGGISLTNVGKTIYMLDPISHNFGAYIAGSGGVGGTNNATNIIVSGQGFFVVATATGASLTFTENAKTSTQNTGSSLLMGTPANAAANQYLRLRLSKDTANADETVLKFNAGASTDYNVNLDAPYRTGYGVVSLAGLSQDNIKAAIHSMPLPKLQAEQVKLSIGANTDGIYVLSLKDIVSVPRLYDVWLIDKYKNDSLDLRTYSSYSFNIYRADTASYGNNRFMLSIRQNPAYAYRLLNFAATKVHDAQQVQVNWNTINEGNYTSFSVERSTDGGKTYSVIGGAAGSGAGTYGLLDQSPVEGLNMYRLKQEDINNTITYSNVIDIQFSYQSNSLTSNNLMVYPNPAVNTINVAIQNQLADITSYNIRFMNSSGMVVKQFT
ncbi:MAG: hypothetical protein JSU01_12835, partial [Bacteroidetes bacterium]|nr:hypothetical protein [Bacteroidota bacterium]